MAIENTSGPTALPGDEWKVITFSMSTGTQGEAETFTEYEQFVARPAEVLAEIIGQPLDNWRINTVVPDAQNFTASGRVTSIIVMYHEEQMVANVSILKNIG